MMAYPSTSRAVDTSATRTSFGAMVSIGNIGEKARALRTSISTSAHITSRSLSKILIYVIQLDDRVHDAGVLKTSIESRCTRLTTYLCVNQVTIVVETLHHWLNIPRSLDMLKIYI